MSDQIVSDSLLNIDIEQIMQSKDAEHFKYEVTISSPLGDVIVPFLNTIEWTRDYNGAATDDLRVIFSLDGGLYKDIIMDYKEHLEITIVKKSKDVVVDSTRYKFIILKDTGTNFKQVMNVATSSQLSSFVPVDIEGQCIDMDLYSLDDIQIEGIYKNTDLKSVIESEMLESIDKINYGEHKSDISLNITNVDNTNSFRHVTIPTGTKILDLPEYLQQSDSYGLFNSSVGTYLQKYNGKKYLYVYPTMDIKQYDLVENKAMIFVSNNKRLGTAGTTFMSDGKLIKIIADPNIEKLEDGNNRLFKGGNAITYSNPDNVYKSYRNIDNGNTLSGKKDTNIKTISTKDMKDGTVKSKYLGTINNAYKYRSETLRDSLTIYKLNWHNGDIDVIYPGMPCCFIYEDNKNNIYKLKGNIISTAQVYTPDTKVNRCLINIAVMSQDVYMDQDEYDTGLKTNKD